MEDNYENQIMDTKRLYDYFDWKRFTLGLLLTIIVVALPSVLVVGSKLIIAGLGLILVFAISISISSWRTMYLETRAAGNSLLRNGVVKEKESQAKAFRVGVCIPVICGLAYFFIVK